MRQILIKQNENVTVVDHNRCQIKADRSLAVKPGLNIFRLPFPIAVVSGGEVRFLFTLDDRLARKGFLLGGAKSDGQEVEVILYNLGTEMWQINPGEETVEAAAYELLKITPVNGAPAGVALFDSEGKLQLPEQKPKVRKPNAKKAPKRKARN